MDRSEPGLRLAALAGHVRDALHEVAPAQRDQLADPQTAVIEEADQRVVPGVRAGTADGSSSLVDRSSSTSREAARFRLYFFWVTKRERSCSALLRARSSAMSKISFWAR